jgi:hypothetical protein
MQRLNRRFTAAYRNTYGHLSSRTLRTLRT